MVLLTTTPQVLQLLSDLPASALAALKAASSDPLPTSTSCPISHKTLIALSCLKSTTDESDRASISTRRKVNPYSLNSLLRNTNVYVTPPVAKPDHSPEYIALMARLRAEAEQRQYQRLVAQADELGSEEQDPITPSLVINIFLSVVLTAIAVFIISRWWSNEGMRVLLALTAGLVVGIAEVVVYAGYVRNIKRSRLKQNLKKEKKTLLGQYTGARDEDVYDGTGAKIQVLRDTVEQNVIWGKGVNGGVRRRVREKWEKEQEKQKAQSHTDE